MTENKGKRQRRTKACIINSIDQAAEKEISANGFISSLVTSIIRKARIEPQVFYNRYTDITDFYDSFVKKYDCWLSEIIKEIEDPVESEQGMQTLFRNVFNALSKSPVVLELIRWELFEKNFTTARTASMRELDMKPITDEYRRTFSDTDLDIMAVFALLIGGIYYLSMHQKLAPFYGIDLSTDEGRERVYKTVDQLVHIVYCAKTEREREESLKNRLRLAGVSEEVITQVFTDLDNNHHDN